MQSAIKTLETKIDDQFNMLVAKQEAIFSSMEESRNMQSDDVKFFKDDAKELMERVKEVSNKLFDFEQNKRNNLIIYGIPSVPDETHGYLNDKVPIQS